jgi:hypothetical protein
MCVCVCGEGWGGGQDRTAHDHKQQQSLLQITAGSTARFAELNLRFLASLRILGDWSSTCCFDVLFQHHDCLGT